MKIAAITGGATKTGATGNPEQPRSGHVGPSGATKQKKARGEPAPFVFDCLASC
jgi:hypothetical protein